MYYQHYYPEEGIRGAEGNRHDRKTDPQDGLPGRKLLCGRSGFIQSDGGKSLFSGGDGEFRDILVYDLPVYHLAYAYCTSLYGSDGISSPLSDYQDYGQGQRGGNAQGRIMTDRKGGFDSALSFFYRSAVSAEGVCDIIFGITF